MTTPICWIVTDGKPGMELQCLGVAEHLGLVPIVKRVQLRFPWRRLSPWPLSVGNRWAFAKGGDSLEGPPPDLLIATGRRSVAASLLLRDRSDGRCLRVQIQAPGIAADNFDLVVVPQHDRLRGPNVITTLGSMHRITPEALDKARQHFAGRLAGLPSPRIAVLVGGSNGVYRFGLGNAENLARQLAALALHTGGAIMITPSRRTGRENQAALRAQLQGVRGEIWDGEGENPYLGYLAYADHIIATADSVNMITEASATGKPLHIVDLPGGSAKFARFHASLRDQGITRGFDGQLPLWTYTPPDDTGRIADAIRAQLHARDFSW